MKTPKYSLLLVLLAVSLTVTSGNRALDYLAIDELINGLEGTLCRETFLGAAIMPLYAAIPMIGICLVLLWSYPPRRIGLFEGFEGRTSVGCLVAFFPFAAFAILWNLMIGYTFAAAIPKMLELGEYRWALDTASNVLASLASIYLWLSFFAVLRYRAATAVRSKQEDTADGGVAG